MRNKQIQFKLIFIFFILQNQYTYCQYKKEGILNIVSTYLVNFNDGEIEMKDKSNTQIQKIWFRDSSIIYELRTHLESRESTKEGIILKKSYPVWRYIHLNLKTMICQDYLNFNDTAKPFCRYILKPTDTLGILGIFFPQKKSDTLHGVFKMKDTIINNESFKRVKILYKYYEHEKSYGVYYIKCNEKKNIFSMNKTLSSMYPDCNFNLFNFYNSDNKVISKEEFTIIRDKLNVMEENIFKNWCKNSKNTKLPLISYSDAIRILIRDPEHENPTTEILVREK
jgi:hypothetical protein